MNVGINGVVLFELELIKLLKENNFIINGLSEYNNKPSIFPYHIPSEAKKPYILFYTSDFKIPLKTETRNLIFEYHTNDELTRDELDKYTIDIINTFDEKEIINKEWGNLRIYLYGKPEIEFIDDLDIRLIIGFIVRGPLKYWGII